MPSSFLPNSLSKNPIVYSFLSWWCAASRGNGARPFNTVHCIEYASVHNLSIYGWHCSDFLVYHPIFIFLFCVFPPKNFLCRARGCLPCKDTRACLFYIPLYVMRSLPIGISPAIPMIKADVEQTLKTQSEWQIRERATGEVPIAQP